MPDPLRPSPLSRLKDARLVQVLLVYLGASWIVLQFVDTLVGLLSLPDWVGPVAVVLLAVGLVVVLATAWVQSLPSTTAAENAGDVPADWEVAPVDAVSSLLRGRVPHLTWGRTLMGGVLAMSSLFGAAGIYVLVVGGEGILGPRSAGAEAVPDAVVVLPFSTRGEDMALYEEGMVDLLSANLSGVGGLRTIHAGTVLSRWRDGIGASPDADLEEALALAGNLGGRYAVRGGVVRATDQVRLVATVYDLADGGEVGDVDAEGSADDMLGLVDELTVGLAEIFVGTTQGDAPWRGVTTRSPDAMQAYLEGEALYRGGRFGDAAEAFDRAVTADSLFALAWWRLSEAWGWVDPGIPQIQAALLRAEALVERLPTREQLLMRVDASLLSGDNSSIPELRSYLRVHPDDAAAWNALGEFAVHEPWLSRSPPEEAAEAFERAIELMPGFAPFGLHLVGLAVAEGREGDFRAWMARLDGGAPAEGEIGQAWGPAWNFFWGGEEERAEAERFFRTGPPTLANTLGLGVLQSDIGYRAVEAMSIFPPASIGMAPFTPAALEVAAGVGPGGWRMDPTAGLAPYLYWGTLVDPGPADLAALRRAVASEPTTGEVVAAAILAALAGDEDLRDQALASFPEETPPTRYAQFSGAANAAEARRAAEAASFLRAGDPGAAIALLSRTLAQPSHDALSVLLMGDALADAGSLDDALRHWSWLYRSPFRPHVRLRMARAYEALGDTASALESYRGFLTMWDMADDTLPPKVEALEAVARLEG